MTNYKKGAAFEFRVRNIFRRFGYEAERKAASSPYDIIVMKNGKVVFVVDAKKTSQKDKSFIYVRRSDVEKIINESKKLGAKPLIVYGFYRTPARATSSVPAPRRNPQIYCNVIMCAFRYILAHPTGMTIKRRNEAYIPKTATAKIPIEPMSAP